VTATESDSALAAKAQAILARNGCGMSRSAPAPADGDAAGAPYDVIVLNGATEIVPEKTLRAIAQWRPIGGRFCDIAAGAGHHRDRFARRFWPPDAVRCRCPGTARHGTRSRLRFLVFQPLPRQYSPFVTS